MLTLKQMTTEYQVNPVGIMQRAPQFAWQFAKTRDRQTAYRIVVSKSRANAQDGVGEIWDSGTVQGKQCIGVRFAGEQLQSATEYFWRLSVQNDKGVWTDSEVQTFETALFERNDWKGAWTALPLNFMGGSLRYRKILDLPENKKIVKARAYVCGLGYHEFYVNGEKVV